MQTNKGKWALPISAGLGLLIILSGYFIWNNRALRSELETSVLHSATLASDLAACRNELDSIASARETLARENAELKLDLQSQQDRAANLAAQRDHLKADIEQKTSQMATLVSHAGELEETLSQARLEILQLEQLPSDLSSSLAAAQKRIASLEDIVDQQSATLTAAPTSFQFSGTSQDEKVFALEGATREAVKLPMEMYLCNADGLIAKGWIHKITDGYLIGHAGKWHQSASALVKGEKVFMLPSKSHEIHH